MEEKSLPVNGMRELYKEYHVQQMHSNGTTAYETFMVILPSSLTTIITILLESLLCTYVTKKKKWQFVIEYLILVLPGILSVTVLSKHLHSLFIILCVTVLSLVYVIYNVRPSKSVVTDMFKTSFITNARSTINLLSVIAILAVDFQIFPRPFAKTESFGFSLMDVGVGLFMFSNGIVAPESKGSTVSFRKCIKGTLILFLLGATRFVFVKQVDYNVPISEYGIHWNFFITLAVVRLFSNFILNVIKIQQLFEYTIIIIVLHELLLQTVLANFVLTDAKRDNFFMANKEGLVSCLGYLFVYLFSVHFGRCLHSKNKNKISTLFIIFKFSLFTFILFIIVQYNFGVSRKLANSAYCFWILFIGSFMTGLFYASQMLMEFIYKGKVQGIFSPLIFDAINYNGLAFFLIGNLLTGVINLIFNTLSISDVLSLAILVVYMLINCLVVTLLYKKQCKLKF